MPLPEYASTKRSSMSRDSNAIRKSKNRRSHDQAVAGVVAGSATVALLHPLDVIKTRLQVQDGTGHVPVSKGMIEMGKKLWSSGGLRPLYAGTRTLGIQVSSAEFERKGLMRSFFVQVLSRP